MKFEENLKEARKQFGYSQEELAERLMVSRQAVSKWENGSAYPELDKLLLLCELFHCTLDDLLKGDIQERNGISKEDYEACEMRYAKGIAAGVAFILAGLCAYCYLEPILGEDNDMLDIIFLIFAMIGIVILVYFGMQISAHERKYPQVPQDLYSEREMEDFHKRFCVAISAGVGLLLVGVILQQLLEQRMQESYANGVFLTMVTAAVTIFTYYGMRKAAYPRSKEFCKSKEERSADTWCGCIMMIATAIYLLVSFIWNIWNVSWIVFPIAAMLCGIVTLIMGKD